MHTPKTLLGKSAMLTVIGATLLTLAACGGTSVTVGTSSSPAAANGGLPAAATSSLGAIGAAGAAGGGQ